MAPTKDDVVDSLKSIIHDLEARVIQLEQKLVHGESSKPKSVAESMRMVLMGPPGAGMFFSEPDMPSIIAWHII